MVHRGRCTSARENVLQNAEKLLENPVFHLCCRTPIGVHRFRNAVLNTETNGEIRNYMTLYMLGVMNSAPSPFRAPSSRHLRVLRLRPRTCKNHELLKITMELPRVKN